jgi:hypothetical protein
MQCNYVKIKISLIVQLVSILALPLFSIIRQVRQSVFFFEVSAKTEHLHAYINKRNSKFFRYQPILRDKQRLFAWTQVWLLMDNIVVEQLILLFTILCNCAVLQLHRNRCCTNKRINQCDSKQIINPRNKSVHFLHFPQTTQACQAEDWNYKRITFFIADVLNFLYG